LWYGNDDFDSCESKAHINFTESKMKIKIYEDLGDGREVVLEDSNSYELEGDDTIIVDGDETEIVKLTSSRLTLKGENGSTTKWKR